MSGAPVDPEPPPQSVTVAKRCPWGVAQGLSPALTCHCPSQWEVWPSECVVSPPAGCCRGWWGGAGWDPTSMHRGLPLLKTRPIRRQLNCRGAVV